MYHTDGNGAYTKAQQQNLIEKNDRLSLYNASTFVMKANITAVIKTLNIYDDDKNTLTMTKRKTHHGAPLSD